MGFCKWAAHAAAAAAAFSAAVEAQSKGNPLRIPFNKGGGRGPDGPWNYFTLAVGSNPTSNVDFYPMFGLQESLLVGQGACQTGAFKCTEQVGFYDLKSSSGMDAGQDIDTSTIDIVPWGAGFSEQTGINGSGYYWTDKVATNNLANIDGSDIAFWVSDKAVASLGSKQFAPLSQLSIEPTAAANRTKLRDGGNATAHTLLEHYHSSTGGSLSISYHYGSAAHGQPGSLIFGGYDPQLLIEPPAIFNHLGFFPLNSISFGRSSGDNPFTKTQNPPSNFLNGQLQVLYSPHVANLHLPMQVCTNLAQNLPITYDRDTNLYLWDTADKSYFDIIGSPSYLNFTFGDYSNTSIRVPFALLNLTLDSPVKDKPTQYFPCYPSSELFVLGRAFQQAALIVQTWSPDMVYVGQAPGPSVSQSADADLALLSPSNPNAVPGSKPPKWEDTWSSVLKPLGSSSSAKPTEGAGSSSTSTTTSSSSSLSGGAIAGIVIGVLAAVALIGAAVFFVLRRRRQTRPGGVDPASQSLTPPPVPEKYGAPASAGPGASFVFDKARSSAKTGASSLTEVPGSATAQEMGTSRQYHEMPAGGQFQSSVGGPSYELPDTSRRAEMPSR